MRKHTVFQPCDRHAPIMARESRYRRAEIMVEGGFAGDPCACAMKPGRDFFTAEFVAAHPNGCGIQGR